MEAFTDYTHDELADLKAAWIRDLRSGDFNQTQGSLKDIFGYCCLGVFCVTAGIPIDEKGDQQTIYDAMKPFMTWFGLEFSEMYGLNDGDRLTFPEIASYIESKRLAETGVIYL